MNDEKDYKPKFKSSAEVLQSLFATQAGPVSDQFFRWKLWMQWSEIVGATTAQVCEPISYSKGVLWLWVKNSTWLTQLNFMSATLILTINQKSDTHKVTEIKLTTDRRSVPYQSDEQFKNNLKKYVKPT